MTSEEEMDW